MPKDYYKILGVEKGSSEDEIKKAYRRLAHEHHPDKEGGNEQKFKDINEAYQVLGDKDKRTKYDQFGSAAFEQGGMGGPGGFGGFDFNQGGGFNINMDDLGDFSDILGGMFGFGGGRGPKQKRGNDIETEVQIDFLESVFGVDKTLKLYKTSACSVCEGSGAEKDSKVVQCALCGGKGRVQQAQRTMLGTINTVVTCPDCHGVGEKAEKPCKHCNGTGLEKRENTLNFKIPAGINNGEAVRMSNEGEYAGRAGKPGDLYVRVRVKAHAEFTRDEWDVLSTVHVSFSLLVLGGEIDINTVDGPVTLKIPSGTQAGTIFKLKNKGVPVLNGFGRGDHLVTIMPEIPKKLTKEQKKILDDLRKEGI
ncbi:MAG: molecular chaperone DnaJ [Patescibacteria group bacterium]|jgi:molecular chaperone DnaJ